MMKNKKADIPVTILVIGVIAICVLAILSFFVSNNSVSNSFSAVDTVEAASLIKEKISFYKNLGYGEEEIKNLSNLQEDSQKKIVIEQLDATVRFSWP